MDLAEAEAFAGCAKEYLEYEPSGAVGRQHLAMELLQGRYFRVGRISANTVQRRFTTPRTLELTRWSNARASDV